MRDLLETIVKSIVNNPDQVSIEESESVDFPGLTILRIKVEQEDLGIVIGKRGRTINAIRDIVKIAAIRNDARVRVVVHEDDAPKKDFVEKSKKPEETVEVAEEALPTNDDDLDKELGL
ncbi:MAG TPA: KH domain-containing protein [bacterium]|nr:KH domain-containing protein [bacterium]